MVIIKTKKFIQITATETEYEQLRASADKDNRSLAGFLKNLGLKYDD